MSEDATRAADRRRRELVEEVLGEAYHFAGKVRRYFALRATGHDLRDMADQLLARLEPIGEEVADDAP